MYLLIIALPFLSFFVSILFGRYMGRQGSPIFSTSCIFFTAFLSTLAFYEVAIAECNCYIELGTWIDSGALHASWGFLFDTLTVLMLIVVSYVSSLVHLYSIEYMSGDPHLQRFMAYLSLFTAFMLVLVTADNFVQMFVGWEGIGLASYLLISFWTTRLQAQKAATKAMIVNRIGDMGLSIGIFAIFYVFGALDYSTVLATASHIWASGQKISFFQVEFDVLNFICFFLFTGAVGKSAQLGLHTWLPDAMEGPTPVSALIHAATLVTAGVFLIVRCSPLFELAPEVLILLTFAGAITAFFAATTGAFQNDLKRVIAYSTCSQLGYMVFACGISAYSVTMFHLMNHAFFKALLFLSAGSIIHAMHDEQDMRKMGGLNRILPMTYTMTLIGSLALTGFPFLTGFYSKDFILEVACAKMNFSGNFAYWLGTIAACFTTFYSYRLVYLAYLNRTNAVKSFVLHAHEPLAPMSIPLVVLAIGSLFIGYMTKDMIIGLGSGFWGNSIFILSKNVSFLEAEYLPYHVKLIPFVFTHIGLFVAYHTSFVLSGHTSSISSTTHRSILSFQKHIVSYNFFMSYPINLKIYSYFNQKWHFDDLYNRFIVQKALNFGYNTSFRLLDNGWVAFIGPYGIASAVQYFSSKLGKLQSGYVYHYAFVILISMTIFIGSIVFLSSSSEFSDFILSQSSESTHGLYFILIIVFWHLTTKKSL